MELWGFQVEGVCLPPNFRRPPSGETMRQTPRCKNALEVLYHHAKFGGARISSTAGVAKTLSFLSVCLSVCMYVRHAFEHQSLCAQFRHEGVEVQKRF